VEIKLAGYNVEADILDQLAPGEKEGLTPETISAAYARISRSPKEIQALRKEAREDVLKARNSNKTIIFEMSHHSIAEHAVFNFDIVGVSRLALEEIEKFRLVSYTEKSQRYVTLKGDYTTPSEIPSSDSLSLKKFNETIRIQNDFYEKAYEILKEYLFDQHREKLENKSDKKTVEGWAKEDARYILSMATQGQVGMTINARNLEHLFRRFTMSQRNEVKEIGQLMYNLVEKITPSLILFPTPSKFETSLNSFNENLSKYTKNSPSPTRPGKEPVILHYTSNADEIILASMLAISHSLDYNTAYEIISKLQSGEKENLFRELFQVIEFFDSPPREFEMPEIMFQAVISASNFAQLKRHRMATLISGDYHIEYGNIIPENIKITGLEPEFSQIIQSTNETYTYLKEKYGNVADYILTNSHCRQVIMKMNLREMYHFIRLRSDDHAQWDIRNLSDAILKHVKQIMPLSSMVLCGKSSFTKEYERIYNRKPGFQI